MFLLMFFWLPLSINDLLSSILSVLRKILLEVPFFKDLEVYWLDQMFGFELLLLMLSFFPWVIEDFLIILLILLM